MDLMPQDYITSHYSSGATSNVNLTCPSCRITINPNRQRSMCPFCGHFYDPNADLDINLRSNARIRDDSHEETLRLPRIVSTMH
jgi:hypothetical protein